MTGNNYVDLLVTMTPTEMITNFKAAAPIRVQEAVKRTVLRCIGSIQDSLVEDAHRTTGLIFAHLVYKAQVTGYMLFNAEVKVQGLLAAAAQMQALPVMEQQHQQDHGVGAGNLLEGGKGESLRGVGGGLLTSDEDDVMRLDGVVTVTSSVSDMDGERFSFLPSLSLLPFSLFPFSYLFVCLPFSLYPDLALLVSTVHAHIYV